MVRREAEYRIGRPFRGHLGQHKTYGKCQKELAEAERGQPVECLGLAFKEEDERRTHFLVELRKGLEELRAKLGGVPFAGVEDAVARMAAITHWPMGDKAHLRDLAESMARTDRSADLLQRWKDEVGFPHGEIKDILNLSDPPWHTACPNPFLGAFAAAGRKPCDSAEPYRRRSFAVDVGNGNTRPVNRANGYHTKAPHVAIIPSILHYTNPGDLVLDGFAGSGMTGVAARWCGTAPESWRNELEAHWAEEGLSKPRWGSRRAIMNDLAPAAGFAAANHALPLNVDAFADAGRVLLGEVEHEIGWMYETLHADGKASGRIEYAVWSEVFSCPACVGEIAFREEPLDRTTGRVRDGFTCPNCDASLANSKMERVFRSDMDAATGQTRRHAIFRPTLIRYEADGQAYTKIPDANDLNLMRRIEESPLPAEVPTKRIPVESIHRGSRLASKGITHAHHLFVPRAAHALAAMRRRADVHPDPRIRHMLIHLIAQGISTFSLLNRYRPNKGSQANQASSSGYRIPSRIAEPSVRHGFESKLSGIADAFRSESKECNCFCIGTASTTAPLGLPADSVDYVFTDPPFSESIHYADLNFLVESWHRVLTNAAPETVVNRFEGKGLPECQRLMRRCFKEYNRVLKPGRWITIVFHNSKASVWTAIQEALLAAGFVVADVRALDKRQGSFRQVTGSAVKQDLVISAYKPDNGLEERFALERGTEKGVWDFVRTHLGRLPAFVRKNGSAEVVAERQPHRLFDRMVAFHVLRDATVPLTVGEFLSGLARLFPERNGMAFLPDQVADYDKRRTAVAEMAQLKIDIVDESSAIQWLTQHLDRKPLSYQEVQPQFLGEIAGWRKHEKMPGLSEMLEQNFLRYDGTGAIPIQIRAFLAAKFKELRNLAKNHPALRAKAKDRWYVPDPNKAADMEKRRTRALLREFEIYRRSPERHLNCFRMEAMRAGFFEAWRDRDYEAIVQVAERLPETALHEDPKLLFWYDQALARLGAQA